MTSGGRGGAVVVSSSMVSRGLHAARRPKVAMMAIQRRAEDPVDIRLFPG